MMNCLKPAKLGLLPIALFPLVACGGSSGSMVEPVASSGFASNEGSPAVLSFNQPAAVRIVREASGDNPRFERQEVILAFDDDRPGIVDLELDGQTYRLRQDPNDANELIFDDGTDYVELDIFLRNDYVFVAELFANFPDADDSLNAGYVAYGFDTDPRDIDGLNGSAEYTGDIVATLRASDFDDAFGDGSLTLNVNFGQGRVSGEGEIYDDGQPSGDFNFANLDLTLEETDIDGNGFAGDLVIESSQLRSDANGQYEGRFYGVDAVAVAGQLSGTLDMVGNSGQTLLEAGFLGE